jgi:hypothetical protein
MTEKSDKIRRNKLIKKIKENRYWYKMRDDNGNDVEGVVRQIICVGDRGRPIFRPFADLLLAELDRVWRHDGYVTFPVCNKQDHRTAASGTLVHEVESYGRMIYRPVEQEGKN